MEIKTEFEIGEIVDTKCPYTGTIKKNKIVGIFLDHEGIQYVFDHKTFILSAITETKLLEIKKEKENE